MTLSICETCGSVVNTESEGCEKCGESLPPREDIRRLPHEVVLSFLDHAEEILESSPLRQAALGQDPKESSCSIRTAQGVEYGRP